MLEILNCVNIKPQYGNSRGQYVNSRGQSVTMHV